MNNKKEENTVNNFNQPQKYTVKEIAELREFIETVKNDDSRSALACWGDHSDYSHGY